ncbi:MAG: hypothetical protein IJ664_00590 [Clostridia bacterium]|nr:hypothetical protein [Clostridia bacterium]
MKKWRDKIQPYMIRPFIYMTFTRFLLALCLLLLINFFYSQSAGRPILSAVMLLGGVAFAILAWIAYLRLDGIKLPKIMMMRVNPRKKHRRMVGDIIDYVDEQPQVTFEELDDSEKDICILGADLFCSVVFIVVSLFV